MTKVFSQALYKKNKAIKEKKKKINESSDDFLKTRREGDVMTWWRDVDGCSFLLRDSAVIVKSPPCLTFKTFELSSVTLKFRHSILPKLSFISTITVSRLW